MGGNITIIVKEPDGTITPMSRWTNIFPYQIQSPAFLSMDWKAWKEEFYGEWLRMKKEYASGRIISPMTSTYFPVPDSESEFGAVEPYGILAIDFQNGVLYSCQKYCTVDSIPLYKLVSEEDSSWPSEVLTPEFVKSVEFTWFNPNAHVRKWVKRTSAQASLISKDTLLQLVTSVMGAEKKALDFIAAPTRPESSNPWLPLVPVDARPKGYLGMELSWSGLRANLDGPGNKWRYCDHTFAFDPVTKDGEEEQEVNLDVKMKSFIDILKKNQMWPSKEDYARVNARTIQAQQGEPA